MTAVFGILTTLSLALALGFMHGGNITAAAVLLVCAAVFLAAASLLDELRQIKAVLQSRAFANRWKDTR